MAHGALTPIIGLRLLALAAGLRHTAEIGHPGLCFSAYGHKFGINHLRRRGACGAAAASCLRTPRRRMRRRYAARLLAFGVVAVCDLGGTERNTEAACARLQRRRRAYGAGAGGGGFGQPAWAPVKSLLGSFTIV